MSALTPLYIFLIFTLAFTSIVAQATSLILPCEGELQLPVKRLVRATMLALQSHEIEIEDVEYMISRPTALNDPYARIDRSVENYGLRNFIRRELRGIKPGQMAESHMALRQLVHLSSNNRAVVKVAVDKTAEVFAPRKVENNSMFHPIYGQGPPTWHFSKTGEPFIVNFSAQDMHLQVYRLGQPEPVVDRRLDSKFLDSNSDVFPEISTNAEGQAIVVVYSPWRDTILIHNVDLNLTEERPLKHASALGIEIVNRDGQTHLLIWTNKKYTVYSLSPDLKLNEIRTFNLNGEFYQHIAGKNKEFLVVAQRGKKQVLIFDPFKDERPRSYRSNDWIFSVRATFIPNGEYLIALLTSASWTHSSSRLEFLSSYSDQPIYSKRLSLIAYAGNWILTPDGQALFAVGYTVNKTTGVLDIYSPMDASLNPSKNWLKRYLKWGQTISPSQTLTLNNETINTAPFLMTTNDGKSLVALGTQIETESEPKNQVSVYDLKGNSGPLSVTELGSSWASVVAMTEYKEKGQYFVRLLSSDRKFEIISDGSIVLDVPGDFLANRVVEHEGQFYFLNFQSAARGALGETTLYRLFSRTGESR